MSLILSLNYRLGHDPGSLDQQFVLKDQLSRFVKICEFRKSDVSGK